MRNTNVKPAEGRLGIMVVGNGAVATTFMTGVLMARRGLAKPIGAMTQYDRIRVGRGDEKKYLKYNELVPLASLDDIVFGCWDVYPQNAYQSAMYAEVLKAKDIEPVRDEQAFCDIGKINSFQRQFQSSSGDDCRRGRRREPWCPPRCGRSCGIPRS